MARVAILGAGSWGTALTTLLPDVERVSLWSSDPGLAPAIDESRENARYLPGVPLNANVHAYEGLAEALADADWAIFAIPSSGAHEVAELAAPLIPAHALVVNAAKGLEAETGRRLSTVIADAIAKASGASLDETMRRVAVLSGPNLAVEVGRRVPTASVAASANPEVALATQSLWMGPTFRVYTSADIVGVELAGAMKNVIAIGAGVCEGIGFGDNSRAALLTRGLAEITRLGVALGAQPATFLGLAGVGDLIATGGSRLSRNYRVGVGIGQGKSLDQVLAEIGQVAEGVPTTRAICKLAGEQGVEVPISQAIYSALFEGTGVAESITRLMMRPPRDEGCW